MLDLSHLELASRCQLLLASIKNVLDLSKRLDHMAWRSDLMNKKIEEMDAAQGKMIRSVEKSESAIATLT